MMERSASARSGGATRHRTRGRERSWPLCGMLLGCTSLAAVALAQPARAAAGQWQAGGRLGAAWLDTRGLGPLLEAQLRHGVSESFDVELQMTTSFHPFSTSSSLNQAGRSGDAAGWALALSPGVLYRWDTLRAVPFAGVALDAYAWSGEIEPAIKSARFGASGKLGLDYLLSRDVVLSVQATAHVLTAGGEVRLPWFQLGLGAAHAWGW